MTDAPPFPVEPDDLPWEDVLLLSPRERTLVDHRAAWIEQARPPQLAPSGVDWKYFLLLGGRGGGKTLSATEETSYRCASRPGIRWAYVAPTSNDLRRTCFEGQSGLLARTPKEVLRGGSVEKAYNRSLGELHYANGSRIEGYSAEQPNRIRGGNFNGATCEELAAWNNGSPDEAWNILTLAVRVPPTPQFIIATTPRSIPLLRALVKDRKTITSRITTYDNREHLAASFIEGLAKFEGTRYGRQEIYGEILDENEAAIFQRKWFRMWPFNREFPVFSYIIVSIDGAYSEKQHADNSAATVWGVFRLARKANNGAMATWLPSRPCVMLLDCWQGRYRYPDLLEKVREALLVKYGGTTKRLPSGMLIASLAGRKPDLALIENKASGQSLIQSLEDENFPVDLYDPERMDKAMRAHSASPLALRGHVWIPESSETNAMGIQLRPGEFTSWAKPLIEQACNYTGDEKSLPTDETGRRHDDELDTMTQALLWVRDRGMFMSNEPMGDAGATEASEFHATDPTLWVNTEEGDRGYGVRRVNIRREGNSGGRGAYDGG